MALENRDKSFPPHPLKLRLLSLSFFSSVALEASPLQHKFLNDTELALRSLRRTINDGVQASQTNNPSAPPPSPRIRPFASSFPVARLFRSFEFLFAATTFVPRNKFWNSFQQHLGLVHFFIALSTLLLSTRIYFLIVLFSSFQGMMTVMVRGKFSGWKLIYDQYQLSRRETLKYLRSFSKLFLFFCFFGQFTSLCAQLLPISRTIFFGDF